jgi:soluble lytic murein transglycosylase
MMQLIPSTAQTTAKKERIAYRQSALLDDPHYNMTLGSAHLSHLIDRYGGSWIMTFAAYNAGPNRVTQWVEAYGDPRGAAIDPLDWMEQIPFEETRNYVQRVLENSQIYRSRLTKAGIAGKLAADIERGGSTGRLAATAPISAPGVIPDVQARIVAIGEPILSPLTFAEASLSHVRVKPPKPKALESDRSDAKPTRSGRRQNFKWRKPAPPPVDGKHGDAEIAAPPESPASATPATKASVETPTEPAPLAMDPVDSEGAARIESEPAYADEALVEAISEALADPAAAPTDGALADCVGYTDFIAETAKEEASADDLNAGALAELVGGGKACQ